MLVRSWKLSYNLHWFMIFDIEGLSIKGRSTNSGQSIEIRGNTNVGSDSTEIVRLRIGDIGEGSYSLTARGSAPLTFDQTQRLQYIHKGYVYL